MWRRPLTVVLAWLVVFTAGCGGHLPFAPTIPKIPGLPSDLAKMPDLLKELGLPDLSQIGNLPGLDMLPALQQTPGVVAFRGPVEQRIAVGDSLLGTDITLVAIGKNGAQFRIAGLESVRSIGDSLDYDGAWPGANGVTFNLRLRIYQVGDSYVRAAGVQQLVVRDIQPVMQEVEVGKAAMKFPYTASVVNGQTIDGTSYGYAGMDDRGAKLFGVADTEYPYRKIGDSIQWHGLLRPDIAVDYTLRMLYYSKDNAQVGGIVAVSIPGK